MRLSEIMPELVTRAGAQTDPEISGITADSRLVAPGFLFAALPGSRLDGRRFIPDAIENGAAAILAGPGTELPAGGERVRLVTDNEARHRFALAAARFFGAQPRIAAAVTGTNGKTSVAWFTRQMWQALGHQAAAMGTLGIAPPAAAALVGGATGGLTTADPVALHRSLKGLAEGDFDHLVLEASSHGLAQCRLDGVNLRAGALTSVSRDHLDYHGTIEAYRDAKLRLFADLLPAGATAVLNADADDFAGFRRAAEAAGLEIISYGIMGSEIRLVHAAPTAASQTLELVVLGTSHRVELPLVASFQASNALCALGLVIACGDDCDAAVATLGGLEGAPGRLQLVARRANGAAIYVDYAHTPGALKTVLTALRPHTEGLISVVFGCGGNRDAGKRPEMGAIAARLADAVVVTDDNPRGEDAALIRGQILAACTGATEIGDRAEAIHAAAAGLAAGDVLVIAGKGHENGQIVGDRVIPFDDSLVARTAVLAIELGAIKGGGP